MALFLVLGLRLRMKEVAILLLFIRFAAPVLTRNFLRRTVRAGRSN